MVSGQMFLGQYQASGTVSFARKTIATLWKVKPKHPSCWTKSAASCAYTTNLGSTLPAASALDPAWGMGLNGHRTVMNLVNRQSLSDRVFDYLAGQLATRKLKIG